MHLHSCCRILDFCTVRFGWEGACLLRSAQWREPAVNVRHLTTSRRLGASADDVPRQPEKRAHPSKTRPALWKHDSYELDRRPMLAAASTMTSYTRWGWESIGTWLDATSVIFAFIRAARKRCSSG